MKIALLGSGGREHALAWKITQSQRCSKLYIMPGNGGTAALGIHVQIQLDDFSGIARFCRDQQIDYLVIGPEAPLVGGIVDYMSTAAPRLKVIGPSAAAARLEGSKVFAKDFMNRHHIRTASAHSFRSNQVKEALHYIHETPLPHVLKADGLAAGKGVIISKDIDTSSDWIERILNQRHFGAASEQLLIEEYLQGHELSCFVFCRGTDYLLLPEVKDYKKLGPSDTGPNTGGMGAVSPVPFVDESLRMRIRSEVIEPTLLGLKSEGIIYRGFLFFGLMIRDHKPYVLEYNVRLGDPEAQVLLPRIENDLLDVFDAMEEQRGFDTPLRISDQVVVTLTMASRGYPGSYKSGYLIEDLPTSRQAPLLFHAATVRGADHSYRTSGGRVLSVGAAATDLATALKHAHQLASVYTLERQLL